MMTSAAAAASCHPTGRDVRIAVISPPVHRRSGAHPCVIETLPPPSRGPLPACCWPSSAPPSPPPRRWPRRPARRRCSAPPRILDGRGAVLEDRDLVVRDGLIAEIVPRGAGRGDRVYDLTALTVLPGYIDTHVHIGNHFDDDGRVHRAENDPQRRPPDAARRRERLPHPDGRHHHHAEPGLAARTPSSGRGSTAARCPARGLLTSLGAVREDTGGPDEIRAYVRDRAAAGGRRHQGLRVDEHPLRRRHEPVGGPARGLRAARRTRRG